MTWIQTYTGQAVDLLNPDPDTICVEDIAWSLARICRYNGHTRRHCSVAEHSLLLSRWLDDDPDLALAALLHDAHEAYMGDIASPVSWALPEVARAALAEMRAVLDTAIGHALGVDPLLFHHPRVKQADRRILHDERAVLMAPPPRDWGVPGEPLGVDVWGWPAEAAHAIWLDRFAELTDGSET